jgi:NACalpha-BTF3-like transcription factor
MNEQAQRVTLSEQALFDRLVTLFGDQLNLSSDISQLKADAKFHKDNNPGGISKEDIKFVAAAAKLEAQQVYEEFSAKNAAVAAKFKELSNYDN